MAITRTPTMICPGETNAPTAGLRYRVVISTMRVLDSAVVEESMDNTAVNTGAMPSSSAVAPFKLTGVKAVPQETSMVNTTVTPINNAPNYARVKSNIMIPMVLDLTDANGTTVQAHTNYTHAVDIVLYVPDSASPASFPYQITSEGVVVATDGAGDRATMTVEKLCVRIITRVEAQTDMLIPAYGFAPINPAVPYTNEACRDFFAQPLFPNGKARGACLQS